MNALKETLAGEPGASRLMTVDTVRIHWELILIRALEAILDEIRWLRPFRGIPCTHQGPAHPSIGATLYRAVEEAGCLQQAFGIAAELRAERAEV